MSPPRHLREQKQMIVALAVISAFLVYSQLTLDMSQFLPIDIVTIRGTSSTRNNKVILLGPHDRYNFGDLLFSKVLEKLLISRAGYSPDDILYGGIVSVDMSAFGGSPNVLSMKKLQSLSRKDSSQGPYDIIYTGGEALGCDFKRATGMMPTEKIAKEAAREKIYNCAYLVPKHLLLPEKTKTLSNNYAVANSLGGRVADFCKEPLETADYTAFRDRDPLFPDSAVMTKELFSDEIQAGAKEVLQELKSVKKYIAVQHRKIKDEDPKEIASALDDVSRGLNATIVFFAAGTVNGHDSYESYEEVVSFMKEKATIYRGETIWKVVGLISQADAVISTSLHVRIMAFIHFKPRVTWSLGKQKVTKFISLWDAETSAPVVKNKTDTWSILRKHYFQNPDASMESNVLKYEYAVEKYLESFTNFSRILRPHLLGETKPYE